MVKHHKLHARKPKQNFYKSKNVQPVQINATAEERSLCEKCPNKEYFWSVFFRIRTEYGDLEQETFYTNKKPDASPNSNENFQKWNWNITPIVGDSMLLGIEESRILKRDRKAKKLRTFLEL